MFALLLTVFFDFRKRASKTRSAAELRELSQSRAIMERKGNAEVGRGYISTRELSREVTATYASSSQKLSLFSTRWCFVVASRERAT
jgi:hypothetical protein